MMACRGTAVGLLWCIHPPALPMRLHYFPVHYFPVHGEQYIVHLLFPSPLPACNPPTLPPPRIFGCASVVKQ